MSQQLILPMIPPGATEISHRVCVWRDENRWTYFVGTLPIYTHPSDDHRMFRMISSQLIDSGACRMVDIIRTFGVSKSSVIRSLNKLRSEGAEGFFKARRHRRGATVMTKEIVHKAQQLLEQGYGRRDTADELGVAYDTLRKAINDGRVKEPERK